MYEVDAFSPQVDSGRDYFQSSPLPSADGQLFQLFQSSPSSCCARSASLSSSSESWDYLLLLLSVV